MLSDAFFLFGLIDALGHRESIAYLTVFVHL